MTESEAIKALEYTKRSRGMPEYGDKWEPNAETIALDMAIKAIEEVWKYRSIGTVERFEQLSEQFGPHTTDETSCPERRCNKCDKYRKENEKYHEIGTVSECRDATEKQRAKKPVMKQYFEDMEEEYLCCPTCGEILTDRIPDDNKNFYFHCLKCGQKFSWEDS